jgi:GntR family transcriptional regulator
VGASKTRSTCRGRKDLPAREEAKRPLYLRTADALARVVAAAPAGSLLPSEPTLAHRLGVSRATLREAMRTFEERGLVVRRQGVGTYVTHPPRVIDTGLEVLESVETLAGRIGLQVEMGDLRVRQRPALPAEAERFGVQVGDDVLEVSRNLAADGRAIAHLIDVLPCGVLTEQDLSSGFRGSVLDLLLRRGAPPPGLSHTEISALSAPSDIARQLHIQRGDVLLCFEASLFDQAGRILDRSTSYFLPGFFRFHVVRRVGTGGS